jgi:hypothetical protein
MHLHNLLKIVSCITFTYALRSCSALYEEITLNIHKRLLFTPEEFFLQKEFTFHMEYAGAWVHEKLLGKVKKHHFILFMSYICGCSFCSLKEPD